MYVIIKVKAALIVEVFLLQQTLHLPASGLMSLGK
jgi:hypothetical protein